MLKVCNLITFDIQIPVKPSVTFLQRVLDFVVASV